MKLRKTFAINHSPTLSPLFSLVHIRLGEGKIIFQQEMLQKNVFQKSRSRRRALEALEKKSSHTTTTQTKASNAT